MMDPTSVCAFLRANFHPQADAVSRVGAGMFSQAFSFAADQQAFIVRLNAYAEDFQKDAFAWQHFSAPTLPIPRVVRLGRFDATQFFAITERCAGRPLNAVGEAAERHVAPALFDALDTLRQADVSRHNGWG